MIRLDKYATLLIIGYAGYMAMKYVTTNKKREIDLLARTAWGEARGDGRWGMQAVINVVMNRVKAGRWWGRSVEDVVLKPYQFSCWLESDPNRAKLLAVTTDDEQFKLAEAFAELAIDGKLTDITNGATNYHTKSVKPSWASTGQQTAIWGNHIFYKGVA